MERLAGRPWRNPEPILHRRKAQPSQTCPQQRPLGTPLLGDRVAHERPATVPRSHRTGELERQAPPFGHHPRTPVGHRVRRGAPRPRRHEDPAAGEPGDRRARAGLSDPELAEHQHQRRRRDRIADVQAVLADQGQTARAGVGTRIGTSAARWLRCRSAPTRARTRRPRRPAGPDRSCCEPWSSPSADARHDSRRIVLRRHANESTFEPSQRASTVQ